ncbi:Rap family tetratricopeptide repeat protein [Bacillus chungangensis]|uniref:Tetratricopeptide (TPR) repeat protein n=1 Tax=Bacillus chungangensis TaxID=587633 RepID=A0ABT9WNY2_9BACI|nr:Rap family tetratricopeptide repeat protein [Bacillus chungangensis]MDQ0174920.1 tetratricopeptide (TPR) repeat protein [Bacillus chungangensis]
MKQKIRSEIVTEKLNDWYSLIRKNNVTEAEFIKSEIEADLNDMEENQKVLLYYSLLDFRHQIMLSYLKPHSAEGINHSLTILEKKKEEIENSQLDDMIEYYFWFFKGMYEFKRKNFVEAITYYKIAEKKVAAVDDEVEKAEFYYKLAEIYYYINQHYLSMNYASLALETFKAHETLLEKKIFCEFIIAGNWVETFRYNDALNNLLNAVEDAKEIKNNHLKASAYFNLGNCYFYLKEFSKAFEQMKKALVIFEHENSSYVPKVLFNLMYVRLKQKKYEEANTFYVRGIDSAKSLNDEEYIARLHILKGVFLDTEADILVKNAFDYLESKKIYAAVEELALEAAQYLNQMERYKEANFYYEKSIQARKKIREGDVLDEN